MPILGQRMEKPAKNSLQCHLFKTESFILKGKVFRGENPASKRMLLRLWKIRDVTNRLCSFTQALSEIFLPEVYFASRSTERDCHLVVPPPAVPCLGFFNCTSLDHWFPNRCLRFSDDKGTIGKNIFQVLTQLKKQACNSQSSVPTPRHLSPENLSGI